MAERVMDIPSSRVQQVLKKHTLYQMQIQQY